MGLTDTKFKLQAQEGFTIVELLIVIVVIAILAAITIVSYNGITARADTSSAQSKASSVAKKAEAYAADGATSMYPTFAQLTATSSAPYYVTGVSASLTAVTSSNGKTTIQYLPCGHSGTTTAPNRQTSTGTGLTPISVVTGVQINFYDFANSRITTTATDPSSYVVGTVSGNVGTFPIACPTTN